MVENEINIPDGWEAKPLKELTTVLYGYPLDSNHFVDNPSGFPMIRIRDISSGTIQTWYTGFCPDTYIVDNNDILIGMDGDFHIRRWQGGKAYLNQRCCKVNSSDKILDQYLYYYLPDKLQAINNAKVATTVKHLLVPDMDNIIVVYPPLPEQERIASILGDLDDLIEKQAKLIEKKKRFRDGLKTELITGRKRLPGYTQQWKKCLLGDIVELKHGYAFKSETYTAGGNYNIITIKNVQGDRFLDTDTVDRIAVLPINLADHQRLKPYDILISLTGNNGRVSYNIGENNLLNQRVGLLEIRNNQTTDREFLFQFLSSSLFREAMETLGEGAAQKNLKKEHITEYEIMLPPFEEQQALATTLFDIENEILALEETYNKNIRLKAALLRQLVTGEIRVV